jgi:formylglycine-generating enzyme required for sulfatase activity
VNYNFSFLLAAVWLSFKGNCYRSQWLPQLFFVACLGVVCFVTISQAHPPPSKLNEPKIKSESSPSGMVLIPAGTFMMGSTQGDMDEKPTHEVTLDPFYIDILEVTQIEFEKVMDFNPSIFISGTFTGGYIKPGEAGEEPAKFKGHHRPVERVTWYEANEYCQTVNKRLPTEAEWEYATRAGSTTKFYWGDKPDVSFSWTAKNARSRSHLVGQKKPNALGLYDMSGNVWEWVSDWENSYSEHPKTNPKGPASGTNKVMRGGSWYAHPNYARSTYRGQNDPTIRYTDIGFRCVLDSK